ncbi:MAG: hypothetical protein INR71_08975, partial [Terriglobus roseus]|nr:hypothetical protein [Terriglobus roseus]
MGRGLVAVAVQIPGKDALPAAMNESRETALATASYVNALKAWSVFRSAVNFPDEADDLVLRLSLERLRFEAWGRVTGLERNDLDPRLFPAVELLDAILKRVKKLFLDSDQLQARYGLGDDQRTMQRLKTMVAPQDGGSPGREPRNVESLMSAVQQGLHGRDSGSYYPSDRTDAGSIAETASIKTNISRRFSAPKKGRWALRDKNGFQLFVETVDIHMNQLIGLLSEPLQRACVEEQMRTSIVLVGKAEDRASLSL